MTTLRLGLDGLGRPRIEALALPFLSPGPTATDADRASAPDPSSFASVDTIRTVAMPAGWSSAPTDRTLLLVVSGSLRVLVPDMQGRLGAGDVLYVDLAGDAALSSVTLRADTEVRLVEVAVPDSWSPDGIVPPVLDEARRSARSAPRLVHLVSRDDIAHLDPLSLFGDDGAQDVNALSFVSLSPGMTSDWHTEPGVSLLVVLSGGFEVEVAGAGGRLTLRPGDVCLVEDFDGQGHRSSSDGETRFAVLSLPRDHRYGATS
jgi:hypothetical protein